MKGKPGRVAQVGYAVGLTGLAVVGLVLFVLEVTSISIIVLTIGIPLTAGCFFLTRRFAGLHRRWAARQLGTPIVSPYRPVPQRNPLGRLWTRTRDPATWRDLLWLALNSTFGLAFWVVGILEALLDLVFWWLPQHVFAGLNARLARALLAPTKRAVLASRVEELAASRAESVDTQAAEIRRIERDLHDGAQARLAALGMTLGLADELLARDPEAARALLAEARTASGEALAELRELVRGIHPPVLADRGLGGAIEALALLLPIPVELDVRIPRRLSAPVESAVYFAVAEGLANVVKHSGAASAGVRAVHEGDLLTVEVRDDGGGGAAFDRGTGLRGIQRRLSAFDGKLFVSSPEGGPTVLSLELPCASSLPKTSRSCATD